ncbi:MAG: H+transporting two-sector ATPase C subunit [Rhodocyclales bacterium]|nr:H+transporting two-sector ATPase C subunit [Rhodocyclales bacterium]
MKAENKPSLLIGALAALAVLTALVGVAATLLLFPGALAASTAATAAAAAPPAAEAVSWGLVGAALATGLSALGAGIAVGKLGAAAVGALAEKPELFGRLLIFVGLAEGIAIYGLIVSILILNRLV